MVQKPAAIQLLLADRCEHPTTKWEKRMENPQRLAEAEREAEMNVGRLRKRLSPDLSEVLHMLDAFEARLGVKTTAA
jgi:hypothetical protein